MYGVFDVASLNSQFETLENFINLWLKNLWLKILLFETLELKGILTEDTSEFQKSLQSREFALDSRSRQKLAKYRPDNRSCLR